MKRIIRSDRICSLPSLRLCVGTLSKVSPVRWLGATSGYSSTGDIRTAITCRPYLVSCSHSSHPWVLRRVVARVRRAWTYLRWWVLVKAQTQLYSLQGENLRVPSLAAQTTIDESRSGCHSAGRSERGVLSQSATLELSFSFQLFQRRPSLSREAILTTRRP